MRGQGGQIMLSCIAVGSNAIRLLEADWKNGELKVCKRERRGTRLFAGLVNGKLEQESMRRSVDAVRELYEIAVEDKTDGIFVVATCAVRDAANGSEFTEACRKLTGVQVEILTGEEEAAFSYYGASRGGFSGVIDIGGGSTEFTVGVDDRILGAMSLQMGAVRMYEQYPINSVKDYLTTVEKCLEILQKNSGRISFQPEVPLDWTGVGGTMTTLGAMSQEIDLFDSERSEGMKISYEEVRNFGMNLASMSMDERRCVKGLMPHRADIIPSGIAILDASMQQFSIREIRLSAQGNMDGYLKKIFSKRY